jgi:hypothetical protein
MTRSRANRFFCGALLGFVLSSCKPTTAPEVETFSFGAGAVINIPKPTKFTVTFSVTNTATTDTTYIVFCPSEVRVLNTSDSTGTPVWTSASRGLLCAGGERITLHPSQTWTESLTATASEVLGATNPDGEYRLEVSSLIAGKKRIVNAGRIQLMR